MADGSALVPDGYALSEWRLLTNAVIQTATSPRSRGLRPRVVVHMHIFSL
jgi:hypothetical protein